MAGRGGRRRPARRPLQGCGRPGLRFRRSGSDAEQGHLARPAGNGGVVRRGGPGPRLPDRPNPTRRVDGGCRRQAHRLRVCVEGALDHVGQRHGGVPWRGGVVSWRRALKQRERRRGRRGRRSGSGNSDLRRIHAPERTIAGWSDVAPDVGRAARQRAVALDGVRGARQRRDDRHGARCRHRCGRDVSDGGSREGRYVQDRQVRRTGGEQVRARRGRTLRREQPGRERCPVRGG